VSITAIQFDATSGQLTQSAIEQMSFVELDATIAEGLSLVHRNQAQLLPFLAEMRERLHAQGKRTDLPDTPKGLTWQKWVENNKHVIGSIRTVNRLLAPSKKTNPKLFVKPSSIRPSRASTAPPTALTTQGPTSLNGRRTTRSYVE